MDERDDELDAEHGRACGCERCLVEYADDIDDDVENCVDPARCCCPHPYHAASECSFPEDYETTGTDQEDALPIFYVAHPVGNDVEANAARAIRWLAWLMRNEDRVAFVMPWHPYIGVFRLMSDAGASDKGHPFRERVMRDNLAMARRSQGIVLVGGRVSPGMNQELEVVRDDRGGWVCDLTHLGDEPPADLEGGKRVLGDAFAIGRIG